MAHPYPKQIRRICFTINNYQIDTIVKIIELSEKFKYSYIVGEEVGENGTKHIQGYIDFKRRKTWNYFKKLFPRAHIEKAKGNARQNFEYCSKDGKFKTNIVIPLTLEQINAKEQNAVADLFYKEVEWRPWQLEIIEAIQAPVNPRTIHWRWEPEGNTGKSYLARWIDITYDAIICEGKAQDIFNQVIKYVEVKKKFPKVIIADIPRHSMQFINYSALEKVKNGHFYSGKYEGGKVIMRPPHMVCFANEEPEFSKLSEDRWDVKQIG